MEPLKGGRLSTLNQEAADILKAAAPEHSLSSWAFRFLMGLDNVQTVLSGMSTVEQVLDNVKTYDHCDPLNEQEQKVLQQAISIFMQELGVPCSGCRYCCDTCSTELDIPLLIKGYNEHNVSGEMWRVADLDHRKHGPEECLQCGACLKHCPQKIDIPSIMRKFASILVK
jgi:predicted aldo/keto reductase-like oxidoreductase